MVETRAQAMANERMDKLEESMQTLHIQLNGLCSLVESIIPKGKEPTHKEAYNGNGHHEGESSHSPHV